MDNQQLAAVLAITGFVLFFLAGVVAPNLYGESVIARRVETVKLNQSRWIISQIMFALGGLLPAVGFAALAIHIRGTQNTALPLRGAAAMLIGTAFGVIFVYYQTLDPAKYWESARPPFLLMAYIWPILAGALLVGLALLQGGYAGWLGYMFIGFVPLGAMALLALRTPIFFVAFVFYFMTFVFGIALLRQ